jgi:hypothetical protein
VAIRYSHAFTAIGTRVEPALGLGYTGALASLLLSQPFLHWDANELYPSRFGGYVGYSYGLLREFTRHPWAASPNFLPNGGYQWLDVGLSAHVQQPCFTLGMGSGVAFLVRSPKLTQPGGDGALWLFYPEEWMRRYGLTPSLWASLGWTI